MQILIQIVKFSIFLTITHHTFERDFLHQSIIKMIVQRWFTSRSKEFSWNDRETVKRIICNLLPFPLYAITRETNRRGDEIGSFYESHPVPSLSAQLEIDFAEFASRRQPRRAGPFAKDVT